MSIWVRLGGRSAPLPPDRRYTTSKSVSFSRWTLNHGVSNTILDTWVYFIKRILLFHFNCDCLTKHSLIFENKACQCRLNTIRLQPFFRHWSYRRSACVLLLPLAHSTLWSLPWPFKWPNSLPIYLMRWNAAKLITLLLYPFIPQQTVDHKRLKRISQYSQCFTYVRVMRRLTTGIFWVFTQTKIVQYSLLLLGYKPVQHVTVMNTVGNCNTMASTRIIILYYIIILWEPRRICGPSLTETSLCGAYLYKCECVKASTPTPYSNAVGYMNILRHNRTVTSQYERYSHWRQQNPAMVIVSNPASW